MHAVWNFKRARGGHVWVFIPQTGRYTGLILSEILPKSGIYTGVSLYVSAADGSIVFSMTFFSIVLLGGECRLPLVFRLEFLLPGLQDATQFPILFPFSQPPGTQLR